MYRRSFFLFVPALVVGCSSTPSHYVHEHDHGKSVLLRPDGIAVAPRRAPKEVHAAVAAANRINGSPYQWGGGRRSGDRGYDCSGATSYVLSQAGLMKGSNTSTGFRSFGKKGQGKWITVNARKGHVFLVIGGLRFDTGWHSKGTPRGPRWTTKTRPLGRGYVSRHPAGL